MSDCSHPADRQEIYAIHLWPAMRDIECRDCGYIRIPTARDEVMRYIHNLPPMGYDRGTGWLLRGVYVAMSGGAET